MVKQVMRTALAGLLALSFGTVVAGDKFKVVTTFTVIADIAENVAGDAAEVVSITKPGAEIHHYEPTPGDLIQAQDADLIVWNGLNLELWFEKFFETVGDIPSITVTEGVDPMSIHGGEYDGKPNPHAWMSISNAFIYVDNILEALVELDSDNAEIYQANAEKYKATLKARQDELKARVDDIPADQRWLVTSEGAFSYLARDMGLKEAYIWSINAEQQGTPKQLSDLIDLVRKNNIPVVFSESTVSDKPAKQVVSETDAIYGGVLYVDSLSTADGPVPTYLDLLNVTTQTIIDAFNKAQNK